MLDLGFNIWTAIGAAMGILLPLLGFWKGRRDMRKQIELEQAKEGYHNERKRNRLENDYAGSTSSLRQRMRDRWYR